MRTKNNPFNSRAVGDCNLISCGSFLHSEGKNLNSSWEVKKIAVDGVSKYGANVSYDCWDDNGTVDYSEGQYISYSDENANVYTPAIIEPSTLDGGGFAIFSFQSESIDQDITVQPNTNYTVCFEIAVIPRYGNVGWPNYGNVIEFDPNLNFGISSGGIQIPGGDPLTYTHNDLTIHPLIDFPTQLSTATSGPWQNSGGWTEIDPYWENVCITFETDNSGTVNVFYATGNPGRSVVLVDGLRLSLEGYANAPILSTDNASLCINDPVDLDDYVLAQDIPTGAVLTWSTNMDPTSFRRSFNKYYSYPSGYLVCFFYNPTYDCFSPSATLVLSSSDLASSYTQVNVTCFGGSNGSIDLTVTGGSTPYTYEWTATNGGVIPSGQEDDQDLSGLVVGTYEVTVTDDNDCTTSETITITSPLELTVTCPADVSLPECTTEAAILSAYNTWIGGFSTSGGLNPGAPSMAPSLPTFECGSAVSLTYNYSVTDDCGTETCSSDFVVAAAEAVDVDGPATDETLACAYADDAALQGAYSAWLLDFETCRERLWK